MSHFCWGMHEWVPVTRGQDSQQAELAKPQHTCQRHTRAHVPYWLQYPVCFPCDSVQTAHSPMCRVCRLPLPLNMDCLISWTHCDLNHWHNMYRSQPSLRYTLDYYSSEDDHDPDVLDRIGKKITAPLETCRLYNMYKVLKRWTTVSTYLKSKHTVTDVSLFTSLVT